MFVTSLIEKPFNRNHLSTRMAKQYTRDSSFSQAPFQITSSSWNFTFQLATFTVWRTITVAQMVVLGCSIDEVIMLISFTHVPRCTWRLSNGKCVSFCFTKVVESRLKRPLKSASKIGRWSSENISSNCTILSKRRCTRSTELARMKKDNRLLWRRVFSRSILRRNWIVWSPHARTQTQHPLLGNLH
jgi:hypothetical protein